MSVAQFFMPSNNLIGAGALEMAVTQMAGMGFTKALIVTDAPLVKLGFAERLTALLKQAGMDSAVFDDVKPNPTVANVNAGLAALQKLGADCVVSLGAARRTTPPRASRCWPPTAARSRTTRGWTSPPSRSCR